jgi:hypothetical protein
MQSVMNEFNKLLSRFLSNTVNTFNAVWFVDSNNHYDDIDIDIDNMIIL